MRKVQLGCGRNRLVGWENHDRDVDLRRRLPFDDDSVDRVFLEHCLEHLDSAEVVRCLDECFRILRPGGRIRIAVPSVERIRDTADDAYLAFTRRFGGDGTMRGALRAILAGHGHRTLWSARLLALALEAGGFVTVALHRPGRSDDPELRGVEGHGRAIGEHANDVETECAEGDKPGAEQAAGPLS